MNDKFINSMLEYVEMDIQTAMELLKIDNVKTYSHIVLCSQQIIEKSLKVLLAKKGY